MTAGPTVARAAGQQVLGLVRACHLPPTVAVTLFVTALTVRSGRDLAGCVVVALAVLTGQLSIGWSNDRVDAARDLAAGRRDKPVVTGAVSPGTLSIAAAVAALVCVPTSLLSGPLAGLAHLIVVAAGWSYNLGLKRTALSWAPYAVAFGLFPVFVTLGSPAHAWPAPWAVGAGALLGVGAHIANVLPDIDEDLAAGVRGLPQRLGHTWCRLLLPLPLLAAAGLVVLGPDGAMTARSWLGLGAVGILATLAAARARPPGRLPGRSAGPRFGPFQAAVGIAAIVVLLLLTGPALTS